MDTFETKLKKHLIDNGMFDTQADTVFNIFKDSESGKPMAGRCTRVNWRPMR